MKRYWTIVLEDTKKPVRPLDSYDQGSYDMECYGLMVYCRKKDAVLAMKYQKEKYGEMSFDGRKLKVIPLGEERCCR